MDEAQFNWYDLRLNLHELQVGLYEFRVNTAKLQVNTAQILNPPPKTSMREYQNQSNRQRKFAFI
jgi:hypothetical protein